jgi:DNA replication protein DnaC
MIGPAGTGKSHTLIVLGIAAVEAARRRCLRTSTRGLKRLKMAAMRRLAPGLLVTSKA